MGKILDFLLKWLDETVAAVILLLPESPFSNLTLQSTGIFGDVMGYINYFVPISLMIGMMTTYLAAIIIWYGIRWLLRIAQYID